MSLDILAFGAHPDDVELGAGGILAKHVDFGYRVGIIDLTRGERGMGTPEERVKEADRAGRILGLVLRENLGLPDRGITLDETSRMKVIDAIRRHQPRILLAPYWDDLHPDHVLTSRLVRESFFDARISSLVTAHPPWTPQAVFYYFINDVTSPSLIVDVSQQYDRKEASLLAHATQFGTMGPGSETRVMQDLLYKIRSRDQHFGSLVGGKFGEGLVSRERLKVSDLFNLL